MTFTLLHLLFYIDAVHEHFVVTLTNYATRVTTQVQLSWDHFMIVNRTLFLKYLSLIFYIS